MLAIAEIQGNLGQRDDGIATAETGFPLFASGMPEQDPRLAHAYFVRGALYDYAGRSAEAEHDLLAAQRIVEAMALADPDQLDEIQTLLSEVISQTRGLPDGIALKEQLIERARRRFGPSHPSVADKRMQLARMQEENGDYVSAEQSYKEAMPILLAVNGGFTTAACEGEKNYAGLLDRLSRSDAALPHFDHSLKCSAKLYGVDSIPYARTLSSRGILLLNKRRYTEAEADFRATLPIFADGAVDAGHAHRYLGRALFEQGQYADSAEEFKVAERVYRKINIPHDYQRWRARADYGYALFRQGRVEQGRTAIHEAMAGLKAEMPEADTPEFMRPLRALGEIARSQGDVTSAIASNRRWHELAVKNYGIDSRDAYKAGYELAIDLGKAGSRASLLEARALLVDAIRLASQFDEPALAEYRGRQADVERAIGKLPK